MAYVHRLIFGVLGLLLSLSSFAAPPMPTGQAAWFYREYSWNLDACVSTFCPVGQSAWVLRGCGTGWGCSPWSYVWTYQMPVICTSPQILNADSTACVTPIVCVPPQYANPARTACLGLSLLDMLNNANQALQYSGAPSLTACFQGKVVKGTGAACGGPAILGQDNCTAFGPFSDTGVSCTGSGAVGSDGLPAANNQPPLGTPSNCAAGTAPGTVNGVGVCVKATTGSTVQSTSSSGTSTTVSPGGAPGVTSASGGSGTSETTCTGASCTTKSDSVKSVPGGGTTTSVDLKTESKDDYCKTNPRSPLCVSSSFGGACSAGFQCDGDAVQCAIAKEVFLQNCKLNATNDKSTLFDVESAKTGNQTLALPGNSTVSIGSSSFDQSNALGTAPSCIQNRVVSVVGRSVTLPFSMVCEYLAMFGNVLLSVSFLLAGRIVVKG